MLKKIRRAVHFDFHTMPRIDNFGENYDAEAFAEQMKNANVGYVNFFARCNIGFSYYDTRIGVPYPGMRGDMLGDTVRACHKRDIGVTAYLNTCLNHVRMIEHPDWLLMRKDGKTYDFNDGGNAFRLLCYNSGYADYFISEIKEILEKDVDGVFCDCYGLPPCYCQRCISSMKKAGIDFTSDKAVAEFSQRVQDDFMQRIRSAVPSDKRLIINGVKQWQGKGIISHYEVECLPSVWGYDYFVPNAAFARTVYDTVVYMNGRFQVTWGDFGGYKGKASLENDFYDALSQGAIPMMGDHLHPASLPEKDIYRDLGEIYSKIKEYERWTDEARYIPEIAIITDSKYISAGGYGAAGMLSELKYTYDIVWYTEDFSKYPLIIIPDSIRFDASFAERVSEYLKKGGRVISSGYSGLKRGDDGFFLPEWSFDFTSTVTPEELQPSNMTDAGYIAYFKLNYESGLADVCYSQYETAIRMRAGEGSASLADEYWSYFDKRGWDGEHYVFYTPPKEATGNSVMAVNRDENVAHVAFPIFSAYRKSAAPVYKNMIKTLLSRFMPNNLIKAPDMPATSRITLTGNSDYKLLHVKVTYPEIRGKLGVVEEHNVLPAGRTVSVKGEYKSVSLLPSEAPLKSEINDGYTHITLPEIVGYEMFLLK